MGDMADMESEVQEWDEDHQAWVKSEPLPMYNWRYYLRRLWAWLRGAKR